MNSPANPFLKGTIAPRLSVVKPDLLEANSKHQRNGIRERLGRCVSPVGIAIFFVVVFWRVVFLGEVMIGGDALYYGYPLRSHAWEIIRHGYLPLWTSSVLGGYPLLAMSQLSLGYPLTWGYLFLPGHWAEQIYVSAPFLLAAVFTYIYIREIGRSHLAALLAALSFAYGGFFIPCVNGLFTNGITWAPLLLVSVERAKTRRLTPYLLLASGAFAMSILNGLGQALVHTGALTLVYAAFISFFTTSAANGHKETLRVRLRPILIAVGGLLLAAGLTAFQTLETWQAVGLSIRQDITYDTFIEGSFTAYSALKSFIAPRFNMVDVMTYVPSLTALLAVVPLGTMLLAPRFFGRDPRVFFWVAVAAVAWILMLGGNTPFYRLVYKLPLFNLFRVPARHSFEWTLALSVLAAYGWDSATSLLGQRHGRTPDNFRSVFPAIVFLVIAVSSGAYWLNLASNPTSHNSETTYIVVKLGFTIALLAALWQCFKLTSTSCRIWIAGTAILLACFVEASILFGHLWYPNRHTTSSGFLPPAPATRFLQQFLASEGRIYTNGPHISGWFDSFNMIPRYGLQNVAGYEPAMLSRYSRALGNVGPDTSQPRPGFSSNGNLFEPRSHVLDILNTRYTTTLWDLDDSLDQAVEKNGINFAATAAPVMLRQRESATFAEDAKKGNILAVVSSLAYANRVRQGELIARIRLHTTDGQIVERALRAGVDTAEWAHERADVRASVPHSLPPIFDSFPGDEHNSFPAYRYLSTISLGKQHLIGRIEIVNTSEVHLTLWKLTVYDSEHHVSDTFELLGKGRWEPVYNKNRVLVLKNQRAMPRVWLVGAAEAVNAEEALQAIRGQGERAFDPKRTALVETLQTQLPQLPGGMLRYASARLVAYEPNKLVVDTAAESPSLLVVSEINYPGWTAQVDGEPTPIYQTNYLLRGVFLKGGEHRVEMRYTAPAARRGLWLSILSAVVLGGVAVSACRRPQQM